MFAHLVTCSLKWFNQNLQASKVLKETAAISANQARWVGYSIEKTSRLASTNLHFIRHQGRRRRSR